MMKKTIPYLCLLLPGVCAFAEVDTDALPAVEDGFKINFFVKEPHIINPSALCFDKLGRLYVGAGPQYRAPKEDSPTDYIKILIDKDGDGVAETVKTFAEGLNSVQAMAWKNDELWVANSPELTVLRDTDGDDVADEYRIIYTGLNNLRHGLHGLNWGPDGWLYMTLGNTWVKPNAPKPIRELQGLKSDDKTQYPLTKVYTKETYKKSYHPMNKNEKEGGIFRCRPGGHGLELYARGMRNPWDMCMDSGFNWLATDNDPGPPGERIFMPIRHGHYSMRHPWKFDWMGKHPAVAPSSDLFPGVSGSGTGVVYYSSKHFPEQYQNRYLIADWTNNCIFLYNPKWDGALQVPAETKRKVVESSGGFGDLKWKGEKGRSLFRPTDIEVGPDGALYMAGWGSVYGTDYVPKNKWTAEENAKYQGRVFRLRHKAPLIPRASWDTTKRKKDIKKWSFAELMEDIGHQVHVWRVNAQDELVRRGAGVRSELLKSIQSGKLTETQETWSAWALGHIEKATAGDHSGIRKFATNSKSLNLRVQAARILGENQHATSSPLLVKLLDDPEPRIRAAAMQSLGSIGWGDHRDAILEAIADEKDRVAFYTAWQILRRQIPETDRRSLLDDTRPGIRLMAALGLMEEGDRALQKRANEFLGGEVAQSGGPKGSLKLSASETHFRESSKVSVSTSSAGDIRYTLDGSDPTAKSAKTKSDITVTKNATVKAAVFKGKKRVSKIEALTVHKITDSEWKDRLFVSSIRGKGAANQYRAELEGLQRGVLVYADRKYTFTNIPDALAGATHIRTHNDDKSGKDSKFLSFKINLPATLFLAYDDRTSPPKALVAGMEKTDMTLRMSNGEGFNIYKRAVDAGEVMLAGNKAGGSGGESMYQVFLSKAGPSKTTLAATKAALPKANPERGKEIFFGRGTCFACHQVGGKGVVVGPDLQGIGKRRDMDYVIQSTLEPDAYIVEGYQQTSLELKDGRKLFGMIQEETQIEIKLILPTGEQVIVNPADIKKRDDAKHSGMPGSFAYTLSPQDVADMSTWIMDLAPAKNVDAKKKPAPKAKTGGVSIKHIPADQKVAISLGGKLFTEYRYGNPTKPILYPVIGPHGIPMTRNFPMKKGVAGEAKDHPHHQSLYYVHILNGHDFWHARDGVHVRNDKIVKAETDGSEAVMVSQNSWMKDKTVVCTDTTELRFGEVGGARYIDFKITMHASNGDLTFNQTKEGTMAIRTHPALRLKGDVAKGSAINSEGVTGKAIWSKPAKWVNYWGPIDGKTVGIAIFDHPKNPRHPTTWHARDYGLITANPFGGKAFKSKHGAMKVDKGSSVTFSYRFLFHEGDHKKADIPNHYQQWINK